MKDEQGEVVEGYLTKREAEVVHLLVGGMENREIAGCMDLSIKTIEAHLTSIYGKLGVKNRIQAILLCIRGGNG